MRIARYLGPITVLALGAQFLAMPGTAPAQRSGIVRLPSIQSFAMGSPTAGWALTTSAILNTTSGGSHWRNVTPSGVAVAQTSMLDALDVRTAWVTASRLATRALLLIHTTDGGRTWRSYPVTLPNDAAGIGRLTFADAQHGWLLVSLGAGAGSEGVQILRTADGGAHWATVSRTASSAPSPGSLPLSGIKTGISFRDATTGWVTAAVAGPAGDTWLYMTHDGGHTWQHQNLVLPVQYTQVVPAIYPPQFFAPDDGVLPVILNAPAAAPAIDFYTTRDGGATWSSTMPLPYNSTAGSPTWGFADRDHGWVTWGTTLQVTTDGGRRWRALTPNRSLQGITQLDFVSAQLGWALLTPTAVRCVGECLGQHSLLGSSLLLRTGDGGHTWSRLPASVTYPTGGSTRSEDVTSK
jgi:photosystem II stability/assembly factor-like uncharacterized protein